MESSEARLKEELYASFKNRAMVYLHLYRELVSELGAGRAADVMKRAIFERGVAIGESLAAGAPNDLKSMCEAFVAAVPDGGAMFAPELKRCDDSAFEVALMRCPLKEAWLQAGLNEDEVARLCEIAAQVDYGTFEAAGYSIKVETWREGRSGCCHLFVTRAPGG